jgi:hypothetical protein
MDGGSVVLAGALNDPFILNIKRPLLEAFLFVLIKEARKN